ncbi:hypothetical protein ABTX77_40280 [Streptomyces sp. NPDC097704]|uniref:hypothetical protein n=1 Tax=Streptomyces sp. NPDC097704 TaxID=3157101 RepID=UPI00331BDEC9
MRSLLESFFDTMDELQGDFRRRLGDIERKASSAPVMSARPEGGCVPWSDRFDEIRDPLGLGPLWADTRRPAESTEREKKPFASPPFASIAGEPRRAETFLS